MFIIEKTFKIPMGHRLSKHKGLCQNFHGHNFVIKVEVCSKTLDGNDMVIDFSDLKGIVNRILENFDHCMLLNDKDLMKSEFCKGYKVQIFPGDPTAEVLCKYFFDRILSEVKVLLGTEVKVVSVSIWENDDSMAKYIPEVEEGKKVMNKERMFPILLSSQEKKKFPDCPEEFPWDRIAVHESQAKKSHSQTLERLAQRGGLSPAELMCIMHDHDFIPDIKTEHAIMWLYGFMGIVPFSDISSKKEGE